jgi:hypothetical protein
MKRLTVCNQARALTLSSVLMCAFATSSHAGPVSLAGDACADPEAAARLKQRETSLLGERHANEHAVARAHRCKARKGLAIDLPTPDPRALTVAAASPAASVGAWGEPFVIPVMGITAVVLNTGKVLFWSYEPTQYDDPLGANTGVAYLFDPLTRLGEFIAPPENIWCAGQTILSDGRVFVAGGNFRYPDPAAPPGTAGWQGSVSSFTFNPGNKSWTRQPDMAGGRWYPTVTQLADNRAVITSGYDATGSNALNRTVEVFTPSASADGVGTIKTVGFHDPTGYYPLQYLMPSGQMLQAGPYLGNSVLFTPKPTDGVWNISLVPNMRGSHYAYGNGISYTDASVTPFKQVIVIAGGTDGDIVVSNNEWLDSTNPAAGWRRYPQWLRARHNANTIILPDGTLFTTGGNSAATTYDGTLFHSELYNRAASDTTGQWLQVAANTIPAAYHSSAVLLPDATVLLSEDDRNPDAARSHRAQIYSPPYLFKGARPKITAAPAEVASSQPFVVLTDSSQIGSVALAAPAAVTHSNDMHQRFVKLEFNRLGPLLLVKLPKTTALTPPGYYMLFVVDQKGIPSVARFVRLR